MMPRTPETVVSMLTGVMLAVLLVNVVRAWLARSTGEARGRPLATASTSAAVQCPNCGAENEVGYRYCRRCIAELPGTAEYSPHTASPFGRVIR